MHTPSAPHFPCIHSSLKPESFGTFFCSDSSLQENLCCLFYNVAFEITLVFEIAYWSLYIQHTLTIHPTPLSLFLQPCSAHLHREGGIDLMMFSKQTQLWRDKRKILGMVNL